MLAPRRFEFIDNSLNQVKFLTREKLVPVTKRQMKLDPHGNERRIQFHPSLDAGTVAEHAIRIDR